MVSTTLLPTSHKDATSIRNAPVYHQNNPTATMPHWSPTFARIGLLILFAIFVSSSLGYHYIQFTQQPPAQQTLSIPQREQLQTQPTHQSPCPQCPSLTSSLPIIDQMKLKINHGELKVWMGDLEIRLVLAHLQNVNKYFEWGSGGSTLNFAPFATLRAVSIEHDAAWCDKLRSKFHTYQNLSTKLDYRCVPKEETPVMGLPGGEAYHRDGSYVTFRRYVDEITNVGENDGRFDFILIDGRARVDCAIRALSFLNNESIVALHDSDRIWNLKNGKTDFYFPVVKYYNMLHMYTGEGKQGIAILRRKNEYWNLEGDHKTVKNILLEKYGLPE